MIKKLHFFFVSMTVVISVSIIQLFGFQYVLRDSTKGIKEKPKMILMQRRDDAESKEALNDEIGKFN